jgi:hypothetical protein
MQCEIELTPQFSIDDLVIQQLALALRTEIQTGCMSGRLCGEPLGTALAARLVQNSQETSSVTGCGIKSNPNCLALRLRLSSVRWRYFSS